MKRQLEALEKIVDVVLAYRPKQKTKKGRRAGKVSRHKKLKKQPGNGK